MKQILSLPISPWQAALIACLIPAGCPTGQKPSPTVAKQPQKQTPVVAAKPQTPIAPPKARREKITDELHGVSVADPYRWLERIADPEVKKWLSAEDRFARARLGRLAKRNRIRARLSELSYLDSLSTPSKRGSRYFFTRRHKDKEKAIYYYREGKEGSDRVLLDPNQLSRDGSVAVRGFVVSWDGKKVAYKLSANAADEATLYVMDVATRKVSSIDTIRGAKYARPSWTPDSRSFYYTRLPVDAKIPVADRPGHAAVYLHRLGQDPKRDTLIHEKTGDPRTFIHADVSRDGRYLFFYVFHGWTKTDLYFRDLRRHKRFVKLAVGLDAKFSATAHRGRFYLLTNDRAPNFRLYQVDPRKIERKDWREIVPEEAKAVLRDFEIVGGWLALRYLKNATTELRLARLNGKGVRKLALPGIGTASNLVGNPEEDEAFFSFFSFIQPTTIYQTSVRSGRSKVFFQLEAPVDPKPLMVEQIWYRSKDGTRVSMFIIRRKDMPRNGTTPFLLYGYGGFDVSLTPHFRPDRFVWLDAGGGLAIPNLRGGGEYGESWHRAGMLGNKQNVFDDFIAAAEYLVKHKYTKSDRLAIEGGSNGGLLVGAAMTQRPELFRAVVCAVPLLDMVRYHLFGSGKTWIAEYGSAADPVQFKAIHAYSPYHHVGQKVAYPALLMLSADSDDRVDPMHARKFVAAIRHANVSNHPVLLRVETKAGHGGGDMVKKRVARYTDVYAFLFSQLGL